MNLEQYQIDANRTCPDLGSKELNAAHMIMGMVSELNELFDAIHNEDKVNIGEELTDQHWYLANYCLLYGINYDLINELTATEVFIGDYQDIFNELTHTISSLTDVEKKLLAYKKPVSQELRIEGIKAVFIALKACYVYYDLDISKCLENNIAKLRIRFPEKFDADKAINRDHNAERIELEKI